MFQLHIIYVPKTYKICTNNKRNKFLLIQINSLLPSKFYILKNSFAFKNQFL